MKTMNYKTIIIETMKTNLILFLALFLCTGCIKKNECIEWYNPEYGNIQINITDYNRASDIANRFGGFEYYSDDCDDTRLLELLSYNGDTVMVYGVLETGIEYNNCMVLTTPGETGYVRVHGIPVENAEFGKEYYVKGVLNLDSIDAGMLFKMNRKATDGNETDKKLMVYLESINYEIHE